MSEFLLVLLLLLLFFLAIRQIHDSIVLGALIHNLQQQTQINSQPFDQLLGVYKRVRDESGQEHIVPASSPEALDNAEDRLDRWLSGRK